MNTYSPNQQVVDSKYISLLSGSLRNFKKKSANLYNFSCPKCGDSKKDKTKARGYIYWKGQGYVFYCHNCSYSKNFRNFLKEIDPRLYSEYLMELMKGNTDTSQTKLPKKMEKFTAPVFNKEKTDRNCFYDHAVCIGQLPTTHDAVKYVKNRQIPHDKWGLLYYTENFKELIDEICPDKKANEWDKLLLPFFSPEGEITGLQARAINPKDTLRYCTMPVGNDSMPLYGLERVDYSKRVYLVEGPIDSLFIPNCLALARADISLEQLNILRNQTDDIVAILDNEPRNKEIVKSVRKMVARNIPVVFWDDRFNGKDINDMILNGHMSSEIMMYVDANAKTGLEAELAITEWSKVR